jgi:hypothetical protein
LIGSVAVLTGAAILCAAAYSGNPDRFARPDQVVTLTVARSPTPPLPVRHYRTSGTYPQVSGGRLDLKAVNAALRKTVLDEERRFAQVALKQEAKALPPPQYFGTFQTSTNLTLISASTVVVSALVPLEELFPGGTDGAKWLSVTVRVPSGSRVRLLDLFAHPSQGLRALAEAVRGRVVTGNRCVGSALRARFGRIFLKGFAPTLENYRHFALTASGLTVGFPNGQIAYPGCGRIYATVPYAALRPYWSKLGSEMVAGVRQPR